jgi:catechol 2,3-dioxygenase-like lactoylglutathione lyase family enzyme
MPPDADFQGQVAVVSVPVSDQDVAKSFYVDRLGFELVRDDASVPGLRWVQVRPRGGSTSLTLVDWFESMPAGSLRGVVFAVPDLATSYARLAASGVEFASLPEARPWATEAVLRDPDGNEFVLQQRPANHAMIETAPVSSE